MISNNVINHEDIQKIKEVLRKFQAGYTNRNVDTLDNYIKDLFINNDSIVTIGTSRSEWCFGLDELKALLENDWKYWGSLAVDFENAKIHSRGASAWFLAACSLRWDSAEDFDEWCKDLIADYYEEKGRFVNYKLISKLSMMNLKLALLIKSSNSSKGKDIPFPIRLSGGLVRKNDKWLINRLQFSIPMSSYPEWRIDKNNSDSLKYFNEAKEKMEKYNKSYNQEARENILEPLNVLQASYLDKSINANDIVNNLFLPYSDIYVLDPNENPTAVGSENIKKIILHQREKWDEMKLNIAESIVITEGDTASIITKGIFKKTTSADEILSKEWENIKEILGGEGKGEDKLFTAQKQIAYTFKEFSFGEEALWEFRFEAVAIKEADKWLFHNIQFTYPSLYVFEGNYNMTPLL